MKVSHDDVIAFSDNYPYVEAPAAEVNEFFDRDSR